MLVGLEKNMSDPALFNLAKPASVKNGAISSMLDGKRLVVDEDAAKP